MINTRISAVWNATKPIALFSCTRRVQEVHTKAEVVHITPGLLGLVTHCIAIGLGVSFNCVQEVHTKAEIVHLTPGLLGLGVLFNCHA